MCPLCQAYLVSPVTARSGRELCPEPVSCWERYMATERAQELSRRAAKRKAA